MTYVCDRAWDPLQKLLLLILIKGHLRAQGAKVIFIFHESILPYWKRTCPFFTYAMMCNVLKHWSGLKGWLSILVTLFHRPQAADRRLKNFKVTGGTHLGWGWGWVRQYHSQSRSPTRAKVIAKVTQGHFKVKYKNHSEGHSKLFQGQT